MQFIAAAPASLEKGVIVFDILNSYMFWNNFSGQVSMAKHNTTQDLVLLDARTSRVLAGLAWDDDTLAVVAELIVNRAEDIFVTPQVGAWVLGCSVPLLRRTADAAGHEVGRHRAIRLAALGRWTGQAITSAMVARALLRAVDTGDGITDKPLDEPHPERDAVVGEARVARPTGAARLIENMDLSLKVGWPSRYYTT